MRVLVVGAAGQVGRSLILRLEESDHEPLGSYVSRRPDLPDDRTALLDKARPGSVEAALDRLRPDAVIDTGALHHVDYCEAHPEEALRVNRDGTEALARACADRRTGFVFISTDYVFDGTGEPPYDEADSPRPISVYGESKLAGELATLAASPDFLVVRPSVIFSWIPPSARRVTASQKGVNFGSWVVDELSAGRSVSIVDDQIASPTLASDLAGAIVALVDRGAAGTYHTSGATAVTRFEFTVRLARRLRFDSGLIRPVSTAGLRQAARRPSNSSLDSSRLTRDTGYRTALLDDALERFAESWKASHNKELAGDGQGPVEVRGT